MLKKSPALMSFEVGELPEPLQSFMRAAQIKPIAPLRSGEIFCNCPIDHFAVSVATREDLTTIFDSLIRQGGQAIEKPHVWPVQVVGCPSVPITDVKHMASVRAFDLRWALLAPYSRNDVIDMFLRHNGGPGVHHIAIEVQNIRIAIENLIKTYQVREVSDLAEDEGMMSQVFYKVENDIRILELVERYGAFDGTFTCNNVAALTRGERERAYNEEKQ